MSLFKKSYLKKLRADLIKESGHDISDEDWNEIVRDVEKPIVTKLKKELPMGIWTSIFRVAEKEEDFIIEINGINIGAEIRRLRGIYEWLQQKKLYFGW